MEKSIGHSGVYSTTDLVRETNITPSPSGFGIWQIGEFGEPREIGEIMEILTSDGFEIFDLCDDCPEDIENITGRIQNQPDLVIARRDPQGNVDYLGFNYAA